jgi:DNA mismatch repair protein MutS2
MAKPHPLSEDAAALQVDLDRESRRALEFDALLEVVASHARTPMGAGRVRSLRPWSDAERLREELATLAEVRHRLPQGPLVAGFVPDPGAVLGALAVEGARIEAKALRALASAVGAATELRDRLRSLAVEEFPRLRAVGEGLPDLHAEARVVLDHVDPDGRILDGASPELGALRGAIAAIGERLRRVLEQRLREPGAESVIRDDFITQRNGRFVIPVRTDAPHAVDGIVHARSSSGATVFVEPLETVPLNNELVRLAEEELEEQERILREWSARFARRRQDAVRAIEGLAEADSLQARALFGAEGECVIPEVAEARSLRLVGIRHPLLERWLRQRGQASVPLDLELAPYDRILVLSGPNAGGKTVALKTLGLAVLMAQSGIPLPAVEARLPLYRQVRADIGDHQSIEADLSTFSAHVAAVVRFLAELQPPAIVLFDEVGTGTEPAEGAALARAILEALKRPGTTAVATTHQGALRAWAFATEGVTSAAMEFDAQRMRPTYRVRMGAAGVSAGLEIALRAGLDPGIVERARGMLGPEHGQAETLLSRLRDLTVALEHDREAVEAERRELAGEREQLRERAESEARRRADEAGKALERALGDFRQRAAEELAGLRQSRERVALERKRGRAEDRLAAELARRRSEFGAEAVDHDPIEQGIRPGMRVKVRSMGREGQVVGVRGERVEVALGQVRIEVERADLGRAVPGPRAARSRRAERIERLEPEPPQEVILIGKTVDEALALLDKSLDAAVVAGHPQIRVVHGHGTGRLREAVRRFLHGHVHVQSFRPGEPREGGDGATVVTLETD